MMNKTLPFKLQQRDAQILWRKNNINSTEWGFHNKKRYPHIVPKELWLETVWDGIRTELNDYLTKNEIHYHTGTHNLLSSWVLCANLYFPIRLDTTLQILMTRFLNEKVSDKILEITDVELEFAFPEGDPCHPANLLGETDGNRGSGQTSPDIAIKVNTKNGNGIVLTECKYTEHSFYRCSARRTTDKETRKGNPDPKRCLKPANGYNLPAICHQIVWGRKYWDNIKLSSIALKTLKRCPAATAGYQLFRQQSLAEGIAKHSNTNFVASTVAFDERDTILIRCLKRTGISDFQTDWGPMFKGKAIFKTWTHQNWAEFVRKHCVNKYCKNWMKYISDRYKY